MPGRMCIRCRRFDADRRPRRLRGLRGIRGFRGFTIVEVLVVVSIIMLLVALLLPALGRSRFVVRVATCESNHRQWGGVMAAYANDWNGWLPRQDIPQTTGVNTWDVGNQFVRQAHRYGVRGTLWACPTRRAELPPIETTEQDVVDWFSRSYGHFSIIMHNLWVPRRFGSKYFPSWESDPMADPGDWATSLRAETGADEPILTDRMGKQLHLPATLEGAFGGHQWGGAVESINALFVDGHVETRGRTEIRRRYRGNWQNMY